MMMTLIDEAKQIVGGCIDKYIYACICYSIRRKTRKIFFNIRDRRDKTNAEKKEERKRKSEAHSLQKRI